ncbi:MAG: uncharacterized protein PWR24_189 [Desulfonauticus sp.]|nr:MAG: Uncharacterized protein XD41_1878 [Desulfonauticus sp. 38_4375]MDK2920632.1 uncharacterized protein [Desulfonauticus sp.]
MEIFTISLISFGLSFLFALGGVGSALVLVPVLAWLGIPLSEAKPTGLFVNTISMVGATYDNIKNKRLDFGLGIPIILSSIILSPIGAYISSLISQKIVLFIFTLFLFFAASILLFFKGSKYKGKDKYKEDKNWLYMSFVGGVAGFFSGLLGIGGGLIISPLLILSGYDPKKVTTITAFVVPFSSLTGFIAYVLLGSFNLGLMLPVGISAYLGGYLGTQFMQAKLKASTVKKFLGILVILLAIKMLLRFF